MKTERDWVKTALDRLDACLQWESLGGMGWRLIEDGPLIVAPALIEMIGGRNDGEEVFAAFSLDLGEFARVFDAPPQIIWSTRERSVSFEGKIGEEDAWIEIRSEPFDDDTSHFNLYADGSLGEK